jgi:hypothetical protein
MRKLLMVSMGLGFLLTGCLDQGTEPVAEKDAKKLETQATSAMTAVENAPRSPWKYISTGATNVPGEVIGQPEMNGDCGPYAVITGFGARVSNGNITGLKIWCSSIGNGALGTPTPRIIGDTRIEATVGPAAGWVLVGAGGVVNGSTFVRAVVRECKWINNLGLLDKNMCRLRSNDGVFAAEAFMESNTVSPGTQERLALTSIGMTARQEALWMIRGNVGFLVANPILMGVNGGNVPTSFFAPAWTNTVLVKTLGQTPQVGDVDLFVGKDFEPSPGSYTCYSGSGTNNENCTIQEGDAASHTYHVLFYEYSPYSGVTGYAYYW